MELMMYIMELLSIWIFCQWSYLENVINRLSLLRNLHEVAIQQMFLLEEQVKDLKLQNEVSNRQVDKLNDTIHELEDNLKDTQLENG